MKKYPEKLFVVRENEGTEDEFFAVEKSIDNHASIGNKVKVAVYRLDHIATVETRTDIYVGGKNQA